MTDPQPERPNSFDYEGLLACGRGELFGPGNAQLPVPPMLMFDRITSITADGGEHLGEVGVAAFGVMDVVRGDGRQPQPPRDLGEKVVSSIVVGQTVHFHNANSGVGPCTLVEDAGRFRSPTLARREGWHHTFEQVGEFPYSVEELPGVRGTIRVVAE